MPEREGEGRVWGGGEVQAGEEGGEAEGEAEGSSGAEQLPQSQAW